MPMSDHLNTALYGLQRSPIRAFSALAAQTPDCVRLTLGEPDFATAGAVCAAVTEALRAGETHYIENNGTHALRKGISAYERDRHGFVCDPADVIVTDGATEALFLALFGVLNPGDEVIVPTPAFVLYERIIGLCRAKFVPMETTVDGYQIRRDTLLRHVTSRTKAIILNSPNNPTGSVLDDESLQTVRALARSRERARKEPTTFRVACVTGSSKLPPAGDTVPPIVTEPLLPSRRRTCPARS